MKFSEFGTGYDAVITTSDIFEFAQAVQTLISNSNITVNKLISSNSMYRGYLLQHNTADETIREIQYVTNSMFSNGSINIYKSCTTGINKYVKSN